MKIAVAVFAVGATVSWITPMSTSDSARALATPTAPDSLTASATGPTEVALAWRPPSKASGGVKHYRVYRDGLLITTTTALTHLDTGLRSSTTYSYEVSAVENKGNKEGPRSTPATVTTPADPTPPSAPTGLQASAASSTTVDLTWQPASDPESGIASYSLYRDGAPLSSVSGTSFTDTTVLPGTTYSYEVAAVNGEGAEGSRSAPATVTTPVPADSTPPTAPTALQATPSGPFRVDLSWQPAADPETGVASYNVYRDDTFLVATASTSISDATTTPSTAYVYEVSAVNGAGMEGARSAPNTVTTPAAPDSTPPSAPTALQASAAGPSQVDLAWQPATDLESGISGYRVYRDGAFLALSSGVSLADATAQPETDYTYEVSAVNGAGLEGARTPPVAVRTPEELDVIPPAPPLRLRIVRIP